MPASKAQQKAVTKYVKAKYDRFGLTMPKGELDNIKSYAAAHGESVNGFIGRAIIETLKREGANIHKKVEETPDEGEKGTLSYEEMVAISPQNCRSNISHDLGVLNADGQRKAEKIVEKILEKSGDNEDIRAFLGKEMLTLFNKLNLKGRKKILERADELAELQRYLLKEDSPPARILAMLELLEIDRQYKAVDEISKLKGEDKYRVSSTEQKSEVEKAPESEPLHDDHVEE